MSNIVRIKILADNEGITITSLEQKIGASKGVLSRALKNNTDIQSKWLTLIVENYPHYNPRWLLTGTGEMINCTSGYEKINQVDESCSSCVKKDKIIICQAEQISDLMDELLHFKGKESSSSKRHSA